MARHRHALERWEQILYVVILVAAIVTRFAMLGDRAISHDESIHTKFSWNLAQGQGFQHNPMMHGPLLFEVTALVYWLLGATDFTSRIYVALTGVALVLSPLLFRRWLGRAGTAVTTVLLLISPAVSYYSRYIRHDVSLMLSGVLLLWCIGRYLESGGRNWLLWAAAAFSVMYATKEASYIYTAIFLALLAVPFAVWVFATRWERRTLFRVFLGLLLAGAVLGGAFVATIGRGEVTEIALDDAGDSRVSTMALPLWGRAAAIGALVALSAALLVLRPGIGRDALAGNRLFDVLMVLGTLTLPLGSALLIMVVGGVDMNMVYEAVRTGNFTVVPVPTVVSLFAVLVGTLVASTAFGLWWNRRWWPVVALTHYTIFIVLYTTIFTWGFGALSGLVGGLAYWIAQHGVQRGNQPPYYYVLIGLLYEYLPIVLSAVGSAETVRHTLRWASRATPPGDNSEPQPAQGADAASLIDVGFPLFLVGWTVLSWIAYSYAGEKMPWLLVHIVLPSTFLGGWGLGKFLERMKPRATTHWAQWVLLAAAPVCVGTVVVAVGNATAWATAAQMGVSPAGPSLAQIRPMWAAVGGALGACVAGAALLWAWRHVGGRRGAQWLGLLTLALLAATTVREMVRLNFVTYDLATEFLVYAHGTPDIKVALDQVREVSWSETGTPTDVRVAYGEKGSWPLTWYMTEFPNNYFYSTTPSADQLLACPVVIAGTPQYGVVEEILGDAYVHFDYLFLWWPIQDYYDLTLHRIVTALRDPAMRAALWDIVWDRDYAAYAALKNPANPFTLRTWPYREEFRLYVRREVAQRTWPMAASDTRPIYSEPVATQAPDPYGAGVRALVLKDQASLPGAVVRGVALAPDGSVFLADTLNHRIWHVQADGTVSSFGGYGTGPGQFNEPWDVAVDGDGVIYVADTWNHRIQKFAPDTTPLGSWGGLVQVTVTGLPTAQGLFYGPRGLAISPAGELYVSDTGNKRVQVFDLEGAFLREFGGSGTRAGALDEPVGISVNDDGTVAVADTWNRRIQLFSPEGEPLTQWTVPTWDVANPDEKPFLTWGDEGYLYVTDPMRRRVLAFDAQGAFEWAVTTAGATPLGFPQGLEALDGTLYIGDAHAGALYAVELP